VTSHELGHNYGAHHASTIRCTKSGTAVPLSSSCKADEYGDPFDVMGTSAQRHLQGFHRRQLGLIGTDNQLTVTQNGYYTVATAQVAGGTPRLLRIRRSSTEFFYLEFRQPYGLYDNFKTTAAAVTGVMLRLAPDTSRQQSKLIDMNPETTTFSDAPLAVGKTFTDGSLSITTVSINSAGATLRIQLGPDTVAPSSPGGLSATAVSGDSVRLDWQAATDDLEMGGYRISRDGVVLTTISDTSWTDSGLAQGVTYGYGVEALDAASNASPPAVVSHHVPDTVAPMAPPSATATQTDVRAVGLAWEPATDNVGVVSYRVRRNGSLWTTTSMTEVVDTTVMDGLKYDYLIRAVDAAGNVGPGTPVTITLPDVTPPTAPVSVTQLSVSATSADLTWGAASDNVAVAGYQVTRDGTLVATLDAAARSYSDSGLASGSSYEYAITAFDAAGNSGPALTTTVATLLSVDKIKPSVPTNLKGEAMPKRYVSLTWTASTDDRPGTIRYRVFRNKVLIATVTTTSYTDRAPTVGWWDYKIRAIDEAGNKSAFTPKISVKAVKAL
jgi:chitodextrinase